MTPETTKYPSAVAMELVRGLLYDLVTCTMRRCEAESQGIHAKAYWVVDMIRIDITGIPNSKEETPHE